MTEREKIAQIIAEHLCPQGRAHKTLYGAERMCYSRNNFAECEKVSNCVDALIAAGIGDKAVVGRALLRLCEETMRDKLIIMYPVVGRQVANKQELYDYCIKQAEREIAEEEE